MQEDLKVRFGVRICLVNEVTLPTSRGRDQASAPVLLIDNSRFLASNIRLYRSEFFAFIGEPEVLGTEVLGLGLHLTPMVRHCRRSDL